MLKHLRVILIPLLLAGCAASKATISEKLSSGSEILIVDQGNDKLGVSSDLFTFFQNEGMSPKLIQAQDIKTKNPEPTSSSGSGFFISSSGHILTNHHVVEGFGDTFSIRSNTGRNFNAKLIHSIPNSDVTVLQADIKNTPYNGLSSQMSSMTGEKITVAGYPMSETLGKEIRVSDGLVNADVGIQDDPTFIQISAPIQPGNSGGPIVDSKLNAIGIATSSLRSIRMLERYGALPQNVNFGVKIATILPFLDFELPRNPDLQSSSLKEVCLTSAPMEQISGIGNTPIFRGPHK